MRRRGGGRRGWGRGAWGEGEGEVIGRRVGIVEAVAGGGWHFSVGGLGCPAAPAPAADWAGSQEEGGTGSGREERGFGWGPQELRVGQLVKRATSICSCARVFAGRGIFPAKNMLPS